MTFVGYESVNLAEASGFYFAMETAKAHLENGGVGRNSWYSVTAAHRYERE